MRKIEKVKSIKASLYECRKNLYDVEEEILKPILDETAKAIKAEIVKTISHSYERCGVTSCAIIKDPSGSKASHIVISTYPEYEFVSVTIESCIDSDLYKGLFIICKELKPKKLEVFTKNPASRLSLYLNARLSN